MDIASLSTSMAMQDTGLQVSLAVMKMGKEMMEQSGGEVVDMMKQMEQSVNPHIGSNIDISL